MPLAPPPLREELKVDISKRGLQTTSLYKDPNSQADQYDARLIIGTDLVWARWLTDLWNAVNTASSGGGDVTCGSDTATVAAWICALASDVDALITAVGDLETDVSDLQTAVIAIDSRLDNVTVDVCGTPFTQTLEDTLQDIVDNLFFDLGGGCQPVEDYIIDIYLQIAGIAANFMPIDGSGSGVVPSGQGIYADDGMGFIMGAAFDVGGMAVVDGTYGGTVGGFGAAAFVGVPGLSNLFVLVDLGGGPVVVQAQLYDVGGGVIVLRVA